MMGTSSYRAITATAAVVMLVMGGAPAEAGRQSLEGRYGMTGMGACLGSPSGFNSNNVANDPMSTSTTSAVNRGVFNFERDGTGSASVFQTSLNLPPAQFPSSGSANITFKFTYQLGQDGAMTLDMLLDTYAATYVTGPLAGLSSGFVTDPLLSNKWVWSGTISNDGKTLLLNNGDTVSKIRFSNGAVGYTICQFERVLTRLTP
jgi:hypothetical protein